MIRLAPLLMLVLSGVEGLLAAASPARHETDDEKFRQFADGYFSLGISRVSTNPKTPDYLRVRFFALLLKAEVRKDALSVENRIDHEILEKKLNAVLKGYDTFGPAQLPPAWVLPPRDFLRQSTRLASRESFVYRISDAFVFLSEGDRLRLDGAEANDEALKHIDALVKEIDGFAAAAAVQNRAGAKPILETLRSAKERLQAYRRAIASHQGEGRAPPKKQPSARERYQYALKYSLLTDHTPDSLLDLAFAKYEETLRLLDECARKIDRSKTWREIIEECKKEPYAAEEYHKAAAELAHRARDFAIEKDLVTIPETARTFDVRKGSKGQITPFGHYQPGLGRVKGAYVTAPVDGLDEAALRERLRDNNAHWTTIVALHEAVPGHHLQFEVARGLKRSRLRRLADTATYVEGWGLYCEEMMFLNGYYPDGTKQRLTALKMRLWRCARVIIDVGLQTGTISKEEAVKLLVEGVTLEPTSAKLEVDHYAGRPTYFCGYLLGFLAFMELRDLARRELGARFDQKKYHDAILNLGPMPLAQLRPALRHWIFTQE